MAGEFVAAVEASTRLAESSRRALGLKENCSTWIAEEEQAGGVVARCISFSASSPSSDASLSSSSPDVCSAAKTRLAVFPNDLIHPSSATNDDSVLTTILYTSAYDSDEFLTTWAEQVKKLSLRNGKLVLRFDESRNTEWIENPPTLGGFSVSLDIKNTEYVTVDRERSNAHQATAAATTDDSEEVPINGVYFSRLLNRKDVAASDDTQAKLLQLKSKWSQDAEKLKPWEISDISIQIALDALAAPDPLLQLKNVAENLPVHVRRLSKIPVSSATRESVEKSIAAAMQSGHALGMGRPDTRIWFNDRLFNVHSDDINTVLQRLREDISISRLIRQAGVPSRQVLKTWLMASQIVDANKNAWGSRVDVRRNAKGAVVFLNDIEKDAMYASFPKPLETLEKLSQQLIPVRRNLYTCIVVLDPSQRQQMEIVNTLLYFVRAGAPVRFGIVLTSEQLVQDWATAAPAVDLMDTEPCTRDADCASVRCLMRLFVAAKTEYGVHAALNVLSAWSQELDLTDPASNTCDGVVNIFSMTLQQETSSWSANKFVKLAKEAFKNPKEDQAQAANRMARYVHSLKLDIPSMSLNGVIYPLQGRLDRLLSTILFSEQSVIRDAVLAGDLENDEDVLSQLLKLSKASPSNSRLVNVPLAKMEFVTITIKSMEGSSLSYIGGGSGGSDSAAASAKLVTVWVPISNKKSCKAAKTVLTYIGSQDENVRVALFPTSRTYLKSAWMDGVLKMVKSNSLAELIALFDTCPSDLFSGSTTGGGTEDDVIFPPAFIRSSLLGDSAMLLINGRVVRNQPNDDDLELSDMKSLVETERLRLAGIPIEEVSSPDARFYASTMLGYVAWKQASSGAGGAPPVVWSKSRAADLNKDKPDDWSWSSSPANREDVDATSADDEFEAVLLVDPLGLSTPLAVALATWLRDEFDMKISLSFLLDPIVAKLPPSSFHRWSPNGMVSFSHEKDGIPLNQLLTLKLGTPMSWIAYPGDMGKRDPDNLLLGDGPLNAQYQIAHVLVDGHAMDKDTQPAAGMLIKLVEHDGLLREDDTTRRAVADSIVMHNLGYWQMKARPGTYAVYPLTKFELVQDKKYEIVQYAQYGGPGPLELTVQSVGIVQGNDDDATASISLQEENDDDDSMHVFSLASGALYERFLRIMMLSVRKRSSGKIKFWLLENYLSQKMKRFLPGFAKRNGFQVELVTFKWPDWLHGQTERQRQIWGMKILFLDVLFPLSVKRVIYVDSDQVLRADLRELWNLDLQGAPYGMTPFCTSRQETLGFQFWRSGYWASHLHGKNYHISALFVVDLNLFRKQSVGDRLRAVYQQLSADPNSLSNLDQDLPNYAQHDIPIFSLPQEWLWCESWCSDASKAKAKTIDLCNNPLHKEPKLEMAKRIIKGELFPESWDELDEMVGFEEAV